jgi:hypothetical protein
MHTEKKTTMLKRGDRVRVRDAHEILATLDGTGCLEGVPFMPEMIGYVGKQFMVSRRVEKICDTVDLGAVARRMHDTVFLEDLRCDGRGHGGCGARCRIYWKEAWLEKIENGRLPSEAASRDDDERLDDICRQCARRSGSEATAVFRCQATEAIRATEPQTAWEPSQYIREISSGNISLREFATTAFRAIYYKVMRRFGNENLLPLSLPVKNREPSRRIELKPGDWVEVKAFEEIAKTLDGGATNRGLRFVHEMLPACGKRFRILDRVDKMIDEKSGRMIELKNDCFILEGVYCEGDRSPGRWFCPRQVYPYWRSAWLRPASPPVVEARRGQARRPHICAESMTR